MLRTFDDLSTPLSHYELLTERIFFGLRSTVITTKNRELYRSRWMKGFSLFSSVDDLKHPPQGAQVKRGRLNDAGVSCFYAAIDELGTIIESRPSLEKLFVISKFDMDPSKLYLSPLGFTEMAPPPLRLSAADRLVQTYFPEEMRKSVRSDVEYKRTISIANIVFNRKIIGGGKDVMPGIVYPSVESARIANKTTINVALSPSAYEASCRFVESVVYCLTNEGNHYQLNPVNRTISNPAEADRLLWRYSEEDMRSRLARGVLENGEYFASVERAFRELRKT